MPELFTPDVLEHPSRKDARIVAMDFTTRAVEGDAPVIDYIGSDNSEDRYGSIVDPKGCESDSYMLSGEGVFCFAHRYDIPTIGKCIKLTKQSNKLIFRIQFAVAEFEFAATIYRLVKGGYMSGSSIGFIPKEWEEYESKTVTGYFTENRKYTKWELLELSAVPVPANRNALKMALSDKVVSENELRAFGLDQFIRGDMLYIMPRSLALIVDSDGKPVQSRAQAEERAKDDKPETCPECGEPMAKCTCDTAKKSFKTVCTGCKTERTVEVPENGVLPIELCSVCDPATHTGTRAGAVLSTKNRARVERARAAAKAAHDDLHDLLQEAFPEQDSTDATLDDDQKKKAAAAARATEVCSDCGAPLADCTCTEHEKSKKKAKEKGEACATCGSPDCACGDKCTEKGCGCCDACTATKKNGVEGEDIRCLDEEGLRTIVSAIRSLTSPTGEAGTTAEDIEGSSTADGDRSTPEAAEQREGYSEHLRYIMNMK
jgi:hypothetical protein